MKVVLSDFFSTDEVNAVSTAEHKFASHWLVGNKLMLT